MRLSTVLGTLGLIGIALVGGLRSESAHAGVRRTFYAGGQPQAETVLMQGERNGPASAWYEDGGLRYSGTYKNGLRHGEWQFFDATGKLDLERSGSYVEGKQVKGSTVELVTR